MKILTVVISAILFIGFHSAYSQEVRFIDPKEIRDKFETSLSVIKEQLDASDPPRYFLYKADISFSVTTDAGGGVEGKIPVAIGSVSFDGHYDEIKTRLQTYTYIPRASIPVNFDDLGVAAFLSELQENRSKQYKAADFVVTAAKHEEEFVVALSGDGKLSFISVLSIDAGVKVKNSHKMTFYFCLLGNDGKCLQ